MPITALDSVVLELATRESRKHVSRLGPLEGWADRYWETLVRGAQGAQLFDAENVLQWIVDMRMTGGEAFKMIAELPTCAPPYPFTYLEWDDDGVRSSALVAYSRDEKAAGRAVMMVFDTARTSFGVETYLIGTAIFQFDDDGRVVTRADDPTMPVAEVLFSDVVRASMKVDPEMTPRYHAAIARSFGLSLFTFSLLHCTNVRAVEVDPRSSMSRQQLRALERSSRKALAYNVVQVRPLHGYRRSSSDPQGEGVRRRLHMVRGRFVCYGPECREPDGTPSPHGLLFGKYAGNFFVPPHARGSHEEGAVAKTYRLCAPDGRELSTTGGR